MAAKSFSDVNYVQDLQKMGMKYRGSTVGSRKIYETPQGKFVIVTMDNGFHRECVKSVSTPYDSRRAVEEVVHPATIDWKS